MAYRIPTLVFVSLVLVSTLISRSRCVNNSTIGQTGNYTPRMQTALPPVSRSRAWCRAVDIEQVVHVRGCKERTIKNRACVGHCYSYALPQTLPRDDIPEGSHSYCEGCHPSYNDWRKVIVQCPGQDSPQVEKLVEFIFQCECQPCSDTGRPWLFIPGEGGVEDWAERKTSNLVPRAFFPARQKALGTRLANFTSPLFRISAIEASSSYFLHGKNCKLLRLFRNVELDSTSCKVARRNNKKKHALHVASIVDTLLHSEEFFSNLQGNGVALRVAGDIAQFNIPLRLYETWVHHDTFSSSFAAQGGLSSIFHKVDKRIKTHFASGQFCSSGSEMLLTRIELHRELDNSSGHFVRRTQSSGNGAAVMWTFTRRDEWTSLSRLQGE